MKKARTRPYTPSSRARDQSPIGARQSVTAAIKLEAKTASSQETNYIQKTIAAIKIAKTAANIPSNKPLERTDKMIQDLLELERYGKNFQQKPSLQNIKKLLDDYLNSLLPLNEKIEEAVQAIQIEITAKMASTKITVVSAEKEDDWNIVTVKGDASSLGDSPSVFFATNKNKVAAATPADAKEKSPAAAPADAKQKPPAAAPAGSSGPSPGRKKSE